MEQQSKDSLKVQALTQRIATVVAQYEEQMADFRAEATLNISELQQNNQRLADELQEERQKNAQQVEEASAEEQE